MPKWHIQIFPSKVDLPVETAGGEANPPVASWMQHHRGWSPMLISDPDWMTHQRTTDENKLSSWSEEQLNGSMLAILGGDNGSRLLHLWVYWRSGWCEASPGCRWLIGADFVQGLCLRVSSPDQTPTGCISTVSSIDIKIKSRLLLYKSRHMTCDGIAIWVLPVPLWENVSLEALSIKGSHVGLGPFVVKRAPVKPAL